MESDIHKHRITMAAYSAAYNTPTAWRTPALRPPTTSASVPATTNPNVQHLPTTPALMPFCNAAMHNTPPTPLHAALALDHQSSEKYCLPTSSKMITLQTAAHPTTTTLPNASTALTRTFNDVESLTTTCLSTLETSL